MSDKELTAIGIARTAESADDVDILQLIIELADDFERKQRKPATHVSLHKSKVEDLRADIKAMGFDLHQVGPRPERAGVWVGVLLDHENGGQDGEEEEDKKSSHIEDISWDPADGSLMIRFNDDSLYAYNHVPEDVYESFTQAESWGSYFEEYIKGEYEYEKLA